MFAGIPGPSSQLPRGFDSSVAAAEAEERGVGFADAGGVAVDLSSVTEQPASNSVTRVAAAMVASLLMDPDYGFES